MGNHRFDSNEYVSYRSTHKLESKSREQIFESRYLPAGLDPAKIMLRESCDSAANPSSTPVIFGLDVTGSMGFVAENIAREGLQPLMESIYEDQPVTDPHIMFMGIGDVRASDQAPLQVSQFEAGAIPLIEQLRTLYLESGGGGNHHESYDLPWYFAAHRTKIDSFDRRGQKGFLFTIGDEPPPPTPLSKEHLRRVFGSNDVPEVESIQSLLSVVQEKYKVFHIVTEEGSHFRHYPDNVASAWNKLLGPNVIFLRNHKKLADVVTATLKIAQGEDIYDVIESSNCPDDLRHAFKNALTQG
jgi:hypothetical protein